MTTAAIWIVLSYVIGLFTGFAVGINAGVNTRKSNESILALKNPR
jgi:hypothetical protein